LGGTVIGPAGPWNSTWIPVAVVRTFAATPQLVLGTRTRTGNSDGTDSPPRTILAMWAEMAESDSIRIGVVAGFGVGVGTGAGVGVGAGVIGAGWGCAAGVGVGAAAGLGCGVGAAGDVFDAAGGR